ncbi:hypothetical protein BDW71DRAFT_206086 [Aspergillus fruticulosus]
MSQPPPSPPPAASSLSTIGNTPALHLRNTIPDKDTHAYIYLKLEYIHPTDSYKDRMALSMVEEAEARGDAQTRHDSRGSSGWEHGVFTSGYLLHCDFNNSDVLLGYASLRRELVAQFSGGIDAFCGVTECGGMLMGVYGVEGIAPGIVLPHLGRKLYDKAWGVDGAEG